MDKFNFNNFLEIFKAFTPYIVALGVYLFWHIQKEKEVIASEAKNLIMKLNTFIEETSNLHFELLRIRSDVNKEYPLPDDLYVRRYIEVAAQKGEKLENYYSKINEVLSPLHFLNDSLEDNNFNNNLGKFSDAVHMLIAEYSKLLVDNFESYDDLISEIHYRQDTATNALNELMTQVFNTKKILLRYALYRSRIITSNIKS
ncbi:hypothetical protein [Acinetobacter courvalinii]|uniref:hypothetical protein n=1 Tax=Acinetobacter courvalinii TaxID=280147 RepID=UPI0028A230C9|nr:hypothetical protein [Acinetobacter courvalinii]